MKDFGKVQCSIWSDLLFMAMSEDARMLFLYLLTCTHSSIAGAFRLPDGYAAEDLGWVPERVGKAFKELLANGFANRCGTTNWVWVIEHFKTNHLDNPNQVKSAAKWAATIPAQCSWIRDYMRTCGPLLGLSPPADGEPIANPLPTVPEPGAGTGTGTGTGTGNEESAPSASAFELTSEVSKPKRSNAKQAAWDAENADLPEWLDRKLWVEFVADRKARRYTVTFFSAPKVIEQLDRFRQDGISPASVIDHAIASGNKGLYPPPTTSRKQAGASRSPQEFEDLDYTERAP